MRVHEMSVVSCEVLDVAPPCEISTYQERLLKSKKHTSRKQSDEEKWRDIYRILFPDEDIPSPCEFFVESRISVNRRRHANTG